jgi:arginyl-tRNA synthetase
VEEKGESFYGPMIPAVINELLEKGIYFSSLYTSVLFDRLRLDIVKESEGALVCFTGHQYPLVVRTSEGTWLYAATDIACAKYRYRLFSLLSFAFVTRFSFDQRLIDQAFDRILYVTDGGQRVHFEQVIKSLRYSLKLSILFQL